MDMEKGRGACGPCPHSYFLLETSHLHICSSPAHPQPPPGMDTQINLLASVLPPPRSWSQMAKGGPLYDTGLCREKKKKPLAPTLYITRCGQTTLSRNNQGRAGRRGILEMGAGQSQPGGAPQLEVQALWEPVLRGCTWWGRGRPETASTVVPLGRKPFP